MTTSNGGGGSCRFFILFFVLPIGLPWFLLLNYNGGNGNAAPPPLDYGTGSMFDLISHRYDMINRVLALGMDISWRRVMISHILQRIPPTTGSSTTTTTTTILDVATGTADVAIFMAQQQQEVEDSASSSFHIVGMDPSKNMLQVGQTKIEELKYNNKITLIQGDARDATLEYIQQEVAKQKTTSSHHVVDFDLFDAATMSFGIRNVPGQDRSRALCRLYNVLKPNATLAVLEFSESSTATNPLELEYWAKLFVRYVVPKVGAILSGNTNAYMHLQHSIEKFPSPSDFIHLLEHVTTIPQQDQQQDNQCTCDGIESTRTCGFIVDEMIPMNFNTVQLYLARRPPVLPLLSS